MWDQAHIPEEAAALLRGEGIRPQRHSIRESELTKFASLRDSMKATVATKKTDAVVAVFDLAGFTSFCSKVDPETDIPNFLNSFQEWLFQRIEKPATGQSKDALWHEQPFFAKFLGDGILLLWDAGKMTDRQMAGLMTLLLNICNDYQAEFRSKIIQSVKEPPRSLRCRVARGNVFSVNNGRDYVGHSINVATHLHDYKVFSFAIARDGFSPAEALEAPVAAQVQLLSLTTRGIEGKLPVWVLRREFELVKAQASQKSQ